MEGYWQAITQIEAQRLLVELTIADYPKMKKNARQELHRKTYKQAYPEKKKIMTPDEVARMLNG